MGFANVLDGRSYPVHHLDSTAIPNDPDHFAAAVDLQLGGGRMDGFVASYAKTLESLGVHGGEPGRVMGYYNAADVPVYDHVAREFAICDRWFSSVPGATWPNRPSFLEAAANGTLSSVSWIDPNFSNFNPIGFQPRSVGSSRGGPRGPATAQVRANPRRPQAVRSHASGTIPMRGWRDPLCTRAQNP